MTVSSIQRQLLWYAPLVSYIICKLYIEKYWYIKKYIIENDDFMGDFSWFQRAKISRCYRNKCIVGNISVS